MLKNSGQAYGSMAKTFHWLIFILVFVMIVGGFFLDDVPKEYKGVIYNLHKLTGVAVFLIMSLRLLWRMANVQPELPADMPGWQKRSARLVHGLLYFFVMAMPVAGLVGASAAGKPPHLGDFYIMLPVPHDKQIIDIAFASHEWIAYIIIGLVTLHVLAALYHYLVRKDKVLQSMW